MEHGGASTPRPYTATRPLPADPRLDLVADTLDVADGEHLRFLRPRDPTTLLYEENIAADEAYPPYWAEVWPSGLELAYAVSGRSWADAAVVELGCGLGLPAIAAARAGGRVLATDRSADALAFAAANAEANATRIETAVCSWADADLLVRRAPWRLVLAADVLYGQRNVDELLALLPQLVDDGGEVWLADPDRPRTPAFLAAARATWRTVTTLPTRTQDVRIHRLSGPPRG